MISTDIADDLHIRIARPDDLDAVEALENLVFSRDELSRRSLRYYIGTETAVFLVLEDRNGIGGDAIVAFRRNARVARLYSIAIRPDLAGRGLGRRLLDACERIVSDRSLETLRLEVRSDNAEAIQFYVAAGYTLFGTYPDYYDDGTAALRYERRFSQVKQAEAPR